MKFKDDIDGRELCVGTDTHKDKKYVSVYLAITGEGYFLPDKAKAIGENIIAEAVKLKKDKSRCKCERETKKSISYSLPQNLQIDFLPSREIYIHLKNGDYWQGFFERITADGECIVLLGNGTGAEYIYVKIDDICIKSPVEQK